MFNIHTERGSSMRFSLAVLLLMVAQFCYAQNAPIARTDTFYVCAGDTQVLYPLANDNDPNGDSIFLSNFIAPLPILNPASGTYTKRGDSVILVVAQNFSSVVNGTYRVCNSHGQCTFGSYVVMPDSLCGGVSSNRSPVANPDIAFALEDIGVLLKPLDNDSDPDGDPLTWHPITQPFNGTLTPQGSNYVYKGNLNYNGLDFFMYRACDPGGRCATSIVTIIIAPINDPPVGVNDTFVIQEDETLRANVLLNDYDVDGDILKTSVVRAPFNGTVELNIDGNFTYQPNKNYYGRDEFTYKVCDTAMFLNCAQVRVLITILAVNDAPEMNDITLTLHNTEGGSFIEDLASKASDAENDTIYYNLISSPADSSITVNLDTVSGRLEVQVPDGFCGLDSFKVELCDYALCSQASVFVQAPDCIFEIELVEGFSPNGDGINDRLVFKHLEQFPESYLVVFNRDGYPVYENEDYQNNWNGTNPNTGQPLPDGTYYYILEIPQSGKRYKNFLVIHR